MPRPAAGLLYSSGDELPEVEQPPSRVPAHVKASAMLEKLIDSGGSPALEQWVDVCRKVRDMHIMF